MASVPIRFPDYTTGTGTGHWEYRIDPDAVWGGWHTTSTTITNATIDYHRVWVDDWRQTRSQYYQTMFTPEVTQQVLDAEDRGVLRTPRPEEFEAELERHRRRDQEILEANRRRSEDRRRRLAEIAEEQRVAQTRALELLQVVMSKSEWESYQEDGFIRIIGSKGNRYEISQSGYAGLRAYQGNVCLLDEMNEVVMRVCAHPRDYEFIPDADHWAGQILALKADEEAFLALSNVHWTKPGFSAVRDENRVPHLVPNDQETRPIRFRPGGIIAA